MKSTVICVGESLYSHTPRVGSPCTCWPDCTEPERSRASITANGKWRRRGKKRGECGRVGQSGGFWSSPWRGWSSGCLRLSLTLRKTRSLTASQHEPDRHRVPPGPGPLHQDHQGIYRVRVCAWTCARVCHRTSARAQTCFVRTSRSGSTAAGFWPGAGEPPQTEDRVCVNDFHSCVDGLDPDSGAVLTNIHITSLLSLLVLLCCACTRLLWRTQKNINGGWGEGWGV